MSPARTSKDLRRPDSVQALRLDRSEGCLVEALSGEQANPRRLIKYSDLLGADVVAPVRSAQNPVELLSRPAFGGIVTYPMTRYDVLLINAPPTTNLSDTLILAQHADATLFAVRSSAVPQKVIEAALTRLDEAGAFICGTVMTQVRRGHLAGREVYDYAYYRGVRAPAGCRARAGRPVPRARMPGRGRPRPRGMRGWRSTRPRSCCSRSGRR